MNKSFFDIRIHYTTGDSYGCSDEIEMLDFPVETLELARENLNRIKEHYECYTRKGTYSPNYKSTKINYPSCYITEYYSVTKIKTLCNGIKLKINDEEERSIIHPFWIGPFKSLNQAEIVFIDNGGIDNNEIYE